MVRKGDILYSPQGRKTITFIQTAADTEGLLLKIDVSVAPGGRLPNNQMHVHPKQTEMIFIKSGVLVATVDKTTKVYRAGDLICIPPGVPHKLEISGFEEELKFISEMKPALCTEYLYEVMMVFPQEGPQNKEGSLPLLQAAVTLNKYRNHFYLTKYPVWLQKVFFFLLAPLAILTGYQAEISYRKVQKQVIFSGQTLK